MSGSSSRLKELNERLQLRNRESPTRVELPPTWREQPVRNVVIASYKKNTDGRYHRHNRMDWNAAQRTRRVCFHDASRAEHYTTATNTGGCSSPDCRGQADTGADPDPVALADWNLEFLWSRNAADVGITRDAGDGKNVYSDSNDGTNDVSRGESRKVMRLHDKMSCILEELQIQMDPAILTICTFSYNMCGT